MSDHVAFGEQFPEKESHDTLFMHDGLRPQVQGTGSSGKDGKLLERKKGMT
jgi:hypothetical protein